MKWGSEVHGASPLAIIKPFAESSQQEQDGATGVVKVG
jgi:hypothetical protein